MKNVCTILLLASASVIATSQSPPAAQSEPANPPFTLTISYNRTNPLEETTADQIVKGGPSVAFRIRKTNTSDQEIPIRPHGCLLQYDVRDSSGNPVAHKNSKGMSGSVFGVMRPSEMLQPGESKVIFEDVGGGYEMDKPGTYVVQVSQCLSDDPASDVVKSNVLTITVVAPDHPAEEAK